jgi:hypothetical protein
MAHDPAPLTELLKINDQNLSDVEGISDLLQDAPFLAAVQATIASNNTQHKYLKETGAPVVGFRAMNDGRDHDHSEDTAVTVALQILDASFHVDQAYADEYKFGREAWMGRETQRHIRAAFSKAESQLIYGTGGDAAGFDGIADAAPVASLAGGMVVNAGGSAGGSVYTSVYAVRSVPADTDFLLVTGNEGRINVGDWYQQMMAGTTGHFNAYVSPIYSWLGCQYGSIYSIGRIANLDATNPLTDDLISQLLALAPATRGFTHLTMNRTSLQQLQASRTATNPTGAPAPFPDSAFNVPIVVTDSITNTEAEVT